MIFVANLLLLSLMSIIIIIYIVKSLNVSREYTQAKGLIEEVILSFRKDIEELKKKIEDFEKRFPSLKLSELEQVKKDLETISSKVIGLNETYLELNSKIEDMKANINRTLKENIQDEEPIRERKQTIHLEPAFPLEREKAINSLTPTELRVLQILSTEGDKTVREIRSRIGLTREHTGRLMKNLYDKGYVERRTDRIPYVYRIKEEMRKILSKEKL
ncbi:MAG TPA: MarR family transcriptional regulator [Candidatus Altiarchaeales archaeon]|nr:MarR family transcriptional regulator [Candidatus Altiarchaeales archaeon]